MSNNITGSWIPCQPKRSPAERKNASWWFNSPLHPTINNSAPSQQLMLIKTMLICAKNYSQPSNSISFVSWHSSVYGNFDKLFFLDAGVTFSYLLISFPAESNSNWRKLMACDNHSSLVNYNRWLRIRGAFSGQTPVLPSHNHVNFQILWESEFDLQTLFWCLDPRTGSDSVSVNGEAQEKQLSSKKPVF